MIFIFFSILLLTFSSSNLYKRSFIIDLNISRGNFLSSICGDGFGDFLGDAFGDGFGDDYKQLHHQIKRTNIKQTAEPDSLDEFMEDQKVKASVNQNNKKKKKR